KESGIETRADFELFVENFPGIQENAEILKALDEEYVSNIIADEVSDTISTMFFGAKETVTEAYNRMNRKECNIP
ncbi:MAG: hypothetical protein V3S69_03590, partial [Dehalococcoidales bacterium]